MTRVPRAVARLARCVAHALHGVAIVVLRFDRMTLVERHATIRWWSAKMLRQMGIALVVQGAPAVGSAAQRGVLLVANHVSWLDIIAIHAVMPEARFVSKADVKTWPLIARLVAAADTLYLERERKRDALRVVHLVAEALAHGQTVAVFPEGTTSDGRKLLPFHANLLQAAISAEARVQPVALRFSDREERFSRAVEFVGRTTLAQSLWQVACGNGIAAHLTLLPPQEVAMAERRALAQSLRATIAACLGLGDSGRGVVTDVAAAETTR